MPRIAEETIQRVAEASDIVEVINEYFPLRRAGTSWRALCPFHKEKSPSFHVNPQRQSFHCFGCGAGGSVIRFVMDYEHLSFPDAVKRLAQKANIPVVEEAGTPQDDETQNLRRRLLALHVDATAWFQQQLLRTAGAQIARDYLKSRGITSDVAKSWQLGYAPDSWDALLDYLRSQRYSREEIAQSGLASSRSDDEGGEDAEQHMYSRFRNRVMFPICNDYGEVIGFSGRVLDAEAKAAKYVNSPETPIFRKGRIFYGFHKSKRALIDAGEAIVCEGQLDLISAFEHGVQNVIAPQGTAFTSDQARLLSRFVKTVILCFDSDRAGQAAVTKSLPALMECDMEVRVARLPEGQDPDSLIRGQGPEAFREAVNSAKNFFDHAVDRMVETGAIDDPAKKSAAAKKLGPFVAAIKDPVLREATLSRIAARLQMSIVAFQSHMIVTKERSAEVEADPSQPTAIVLDEGVKQLCRFALMSPDVRVWLGEQSFPATSEIGDGGTLLEKIITSPLPLEESAGRIAFVSTLSRPEELAINSLDTEKPPEHVLAIAQNAWNGMAVLSLRNQSANAQSQLRQANLSGAERNRLQTIVAEISKQILDLQSRLNEF